MRKRTISKRLSYWQKRLGMQNWEISYDYKMKKHGAYENSNFPTVASCDADPQYKNANISFNPRKLNRIDDGVIVHELLHCIFRQHPIRIKPWQKWFYDLVGKVIVFPDYDYEEETIVTEFERIIIRMWKRCG